MFVRKHAPVQSGYLLRMVCFGAVPAGNRNNTGTQFGGRGTNVNYWSSSVSSSSNAWRRNFDYNSAQVNRNNSNRSNGFSVRCVRESKRYKHKPTAFLSKDYMGAFFG
jgi:uncharacterized protein (TIGR02145 family)